MEVEAAAKAEAAGPGGRGGHRAEVQGATTGPQAAGMLVVVEVYNASAHPVSQFESIIEDACCISSDQR